MVWTRVLVWKPLKKGLKKSLLFRYCFGKILLNKVYNCVLCEKSNKLFCYWKINIYFLVFQFLWWRRISFRFSTLYLPLVKSPKLYQKLRKKNLSKKNCQKICQKIHQKNCQKLRQKIVKKIHNKCCQKINRQTSRYQHQVTLSNTKVTNSLDARQPRNFRFLDIIKTQNQYDRKFHNVYNSNFRGLYTTLYPDLFISSSKNSPSKQKNSPTQKGPRFTRH
jgi:hypothetical protein